MERIKVTYYLAAPLVKGVRVAAAASGCRDYQFVEDALQQHLESATVQAAIRDAASGLEPHSLTPPAI